MRSFIHARLVECAITLAISAVWSTMGAQSLAQTVWSGLTYQFTKPDNQPAPYSQDKITPNVSLTRGFDRGLYNGVLDGGWNGSGPSDTEWATQFNNPGKTIAATNYQNLDSFGTWLEAFGGGGVGFNIPGVDAVVHLITDDIYLDLRFTDWQTSGGGGFAYVRAEAPIPEPSTIVLAIAAGGLLALPRRKRSP